MSRSFAKRVSVTFSWLSHHDSFERTHSWPIKNRTWNSIHKFKCLWHVYCIERIRVKIQNFAKKSSALFASKKGEIRTWVELKKERRPWRARIEISAWPKIHGSVHDWTRWPPFKRYNFSFSKSKQDKKQQHSTFLRHFENHKTRQYPGNRSF